VRGKADLLQLVLLVGFPGCLKDQNEVVLSFLTEFFYGSKEARPPFSERAVLLLLGFSCGESGGSSLYYTFFSPPLQVAELVAQPPFFSRPNRYVFR